jgi:hypothetical protein
MPLHLPAIRQEAAFPVHLIMLVVQANQRVETDFALTGPISQGFVWLKLLEYFSI